jgi:hypothetical protein
LLNHIPKMAVKFGVILIRLPHGLEMDQIFSKLHCEKLHLKFCKFLLGVYRKSTNIAVVRTMPVYGAIP